MNYLYEIMSSYIHTDYTQPCYLAVLFTFIYMATHYTFYYHIREIFLLPLHAYFFEPIASLFIFHRSILLKQLIKVELKMTFILINTSFS